jgi:hypothetical protein
MEAPGAGSFRVFAEGWDLNRVREPRADPSYKRKEKKPHSLEWDCSEFRLQLFYAKDQTNTDRPVLLLLVHPGALNLLTVLIGSRGGDSAGLAISRDHNATRHGSFSIFFVGHRECVVIDLFVRACVRRRIAGDGIVFAIKLPRPFAMNRLTVFICAIHRHFCVVARSLVHHRVVLGRPRGKLRLALIQFPGARKRIVGETQSHPGKAQHQGQYNRFRFHSPSF